MSSEVTAQQLNILIMDFATYSKLIFQISSRSKYILTWHQLVQYKIYLEITSQFSNIW